MKCNSIHKFRVPRARRFERRLNAEGFTLIEVMIAIMLLVFISIAIYQATTQTFKYRAKIINEGDFYGGIRLAMGLMDRDVSALFSPVNMNPKNFKEATTVNTAPNPQQGGFGNPRAGFRARPDASVEDQTQEATQLEELGRSDLGKVSDYWLPATDITAIRPSRFQGTETRIQFVTASHQRVYKDKPESDFAKIFYELRDQKSPDIEGTRLLVRVEDVNVFDDVSKKDTTAITYPLLPGVKKLGFRYYRKDKKSWERTWDTDREDMRGLYPDLIEVTIEVAGFNRSPFLGTYMLKPEAMFYGMDPTL